ncbi:Os06g0473366 [Oryza sativa Japonica Group]|uniref:Os06g0473366 protein n=2 Tax=Oryza sativa subsp. japonica TaxID=39947 RepID=A0A0P0WWM0_ORYSJ|nr:Os06g0473366 [Oryza sativa Japonica Group]
MSKYLQGYRRGRSFDLPMTVEERLRIALITDAALQQGQGHRVLLHAMAALTMAAAPTTSNSSPAGASCPFVCEGSTTISPPTGAPSPVRCDDGVDDSGRTTAVDGARLGQRYGW